MTHPSVPPLIFGCLSLADAVLIYCCLPETAGSAMPDTISDVEDEEGEISATDRVRYGSTDARPD